MDVPVVCFLKQTCIVAVHIFFKSFHKYLPNISFSGMTALKFLKPCSVLFLTLSKTIILDYELMLMFFDLIIIGFRILAEQTKDNNAFRYK